MEDDPAEDVAMEESQAMSGDDDCGGEMEIDSDTDNLAMHREEQPDDFPEDANEDAEMTDPDEPGGGEPEPECYEDLLDLFNDSGEDESDSGAEEGESGVKQILDPRSKVHRGGQHAVARCCDPNCKNKDTSNELRVCIQGWRSNKYASFFHVKCLGNNFNIDWHKEQYRKYGTQGVWLGYHDPHSTTRRVE